MLPNTICKTCLSTNTKVTPLACHPVRVSRYQCKPSKMHAAICGCDSHKTLRSHLLNNFNPSHGFQNLSLFSTRSNQNKIGIAKINYTKVNGALIGSTCSPAEIICVNLPNGNTFRVQIHYDDGAMHTLTSSGTHPLVLSKHLSSEPIELSTITGKDSRVRQIVRLKLSDTCSIEAIGLQSLNIVANSLDIPDAWNRYKDNWAIPVVGCMYNDAQIL